MELQQIVALLIVAAAALFLARNFVRSLRAFLSGKGGCESGCGKCGFAPRDDRSSVRPAAPSRPNIIPLTDIRTVRSPRDGEPQ